ncbi:hypothetical protein BDF19DRAFT_494121 [Syncephalis fuscata]|nr:hypothetical protein BDF19DRAFT_494121 [Syncephalis fuscata]
MTQDSLSGDLGGVDFVWGARNETASLRRRYLAINCQILFAMLMAIIFLRNTYRAVYVIATYPRKIAPLCCLSTNLFGAFSAIIIAIPSVALNVFSCYTLCWTLAIGLMVSAASVNTILFERAYLACNRLKWFLVLSIIMISVPGPAYIIIIQHSADPKYNEIHGCYLNYRSYFPYIRLSLDLPPNIAFSAVFLMVIYRQYKRYKEACWKKLVKDGVITMLLIIASNIACFIINTTNILKETGDLMYVADWVLTATLLVDNIYKLHITSQSDESNESNKNPDKTTALSIKDQTTTRNRFGLTGMATTYI